jgi:uncharacterized membrane protein YkoI
MQTIKEAVTKLEKQEYFKEHKDIFLLNAFSILENDPNWQLNYYNKETNKVISFIPAEDKTLEEQDLLEQNTNPKELNLDKIEITLKEALKTLEKEKTKETITKTIVIIHSLDDKVVWNFTLLTTSFNVIKIKIDATTGNIIDNKSEPVMNFKK